MELPIVDAHVHLWNLRRARYPWLTEELGPLHRTFEPAELEAELRMAGVDRAVLVQAANSLEDTRLMLEIAATHPWVAAVVGWVPLDDPHSAEAALDELAELRGVRDLVHSARDPDWLLQPSVLDSLRLLAERGLVLELPDSYPGFLRHVPALCEAAPGLTIVIDHLGKPPFRREPLDRWAAQLRAAAEAAPAVVAKVSGLDTAVGADDWTAEELRPAFELALERFGAGRLLFGSDWPVCLLGGGYARVWTATQRLLAGLDPAGRKAILGGTAARVYGLATSAA